MRSDLKGMKVWLAARGRDKSGRGAGAFLLSPIASRGLDVLAGMLWVPKKR
jgi:hypothetical protein